MKHLLANLPKVDKVLADDRISQWQDQLAGAYIKETIQVEIDRLRQAILQEELKDEGQVAFDQVVSQIDQALQERIQPSLKPVINATGTVLHTDLGLSLIHI